MSGVGKSRSADSLVGGPAADQAYVQKLLAALPPSRDLLKHYQVLFDQVRPCVSSWTQDDYLSSFPVYLRLDLKWRTERSAAFLCERSTECITTEC